MQVFLFMMAPGMKPDLKITLDDLVKCSTLGDNDNPPEGLEMVLSFFNGPEDMKAAIEKLRTGKTHGCWDESGSTPVGIGATLNAAKLACLDYYMTEAEH